MPGKGLLGTVHSGNRGRASSKGLLTANSSRTSLEVCMPRMGEAGVDCVPYSMSVRIVVQCVESRCISMTRAEEVEGEEGEVPRTNILGSQERVMGLEPTTATLATWRSTTELHPHGLKIHGSRSSTYPELYKSLDS